MRWLLLLASLFGGAIYAQPQVLDDFNDATRWHAGASDQVKATAQRGARGGV